MNIKVQLLTCFQPAQWYSLRLAAACSPYGEVRRGSQIKRRLTAYQICGGLQRLTVAARGSTKCTITRTFFDYIRYWSLFVCQNCRHYITRSAVSLYLLLKLNKLELVSSQGDFAICGVAIQLLSCHTQKTTAQRPMPVKPEVP